MIELRQYQLEAKQKVRDAIRAGKKRILLVAPTGSGKTVIAADFLRSSRAKGKMSLFIAHRRELIHQASKKLTAFGVDHGIIMGEYSMSALAETQVASIQSFYSRVIKRNKISPPLADLVFIDECFPAGTLVDGKPIQSITVGDEVSSVDHDTGGIVRRRVLRVFQYKSVSDIIVLQCDATEIKCTDNHPIFVRGKGYVEAQKIVEGDLLCMQRTIPAVDCMATEQNLFKKVQAQEIIENYVEYEQEICVSTHEEKKPDDEKNIQRQNESNPDCNETQAKNQGRKWYGGHQGGESDCSRNEDETPCDSANRATTQRKLSESLQVGCRGPNQEDLYRSRRAEPRSFEQEDSRCKEGQFLAWIRVDRISRDEQTSVDGIEVYNLEVEGTHNYFANGILVHNCHHATANSYLHLKDIYEDDIIIGLTATPCRTDGRGLGGFFDELIQVATPQELIDLGYLVDTKIVAPRLPDLRGLRTVRGDYEEAELEKRMKPMIGDLVNDWQHFANGRPTFVFAVTVAHSIWIKERFENAGIICEHVDAQTHPAKRDQIFSDFEAGRLQVLTNVGIATEGTDIPCASCAILARPTKSYGLYLQMTGRICRPFPGKKDALIIDHSGAVYQHGFPQDAGGWELDQNFKITDRNQERLAKEQNPITCRECFTVYVKQLHCPNCGALPNKRGQSLSMEEGRLYHIPRQKKQKVETFTVEQKADWYGQLKALELAGGKKNGWAAHKYREKMGVWPNLPEIRHAPHRTPTPEVKSFVQAMNIRYAKSRDRQALQR